MRSSAWIAAVTLLIPFHSANGQHDSPSKLPDPSSLTANNPTTATLGTPHANDGSTAQASTGGKVLPDASKCAPCELTPDQALNFFNVNEQKAVAPGVGELATSLGAVSDNLTVLTLQKDIKLILGGAVTADFLINSARPLSPGTPFFLLPDSPFGFSQRTIDFNARQTALYALVLGPKVHGFDTGAVALGTFFDNAIIVDKYGFLPIQAFGYAKNEWWRFSAGLQFDIFNPLLPTVLPFSRLQASGNAGNAFRGQLRADRFFYHSPNSKTIVTVGLSEPVPTTLNPEFVLQEDNGWPNVESRVAWTTGPLQGEGPAAKHPFEVGVSGLVGQIRTSMGPTRVVADVWAVGADVRCALSHRSGFQAEVFSGQTIGTYGGGILQNTNPITFEGIRATGGWVEFYYYLCPDYLHTHVGFGIDDPLDKDLSPTQPLRNQTWFANLIWDINQHCRVAAELTYRQTWYGILPDNEGAGFHTQFQWKF